MNTVISKDGTRIAYNKSGSGPAVILVDGAFCSKDFGPMPKIAALLAQKFTVLAYDRRARGESGDTKPYAIEREIEDIDALIKTIGGPASLFGISSGAILCIRAVVYGLAIDKLAVFEPPYVGITDDNMPGNAFEELSRLIDVGKQGDAVKYYLRKLIKVPAIIVFILRLTANWAKMKRNANSLPYDAAVCADFNIPAKEIASIKIPAIAIDSTKSPAKLRNAVQSVAAALPNGRRLSLPGKVHDIPAETLVPELEKFFTS